MESEKNKKRERTDAKLEPRGLVRCSSSTDEKKEEEETTTEPPEEVEPEHRGLVRCSSSNEEKKKSKFRSLKPLITTVTKTTSTTDSITIITPLEDPNTHINLYLCIRTGSDAFSWMKIDPTNTTAEAPIIHKSSKSNSKGNNNKKKKKKKKNQQQRILLTPISNMPPTTPRSFRPIPLSSDKHKLVYALGGHVVINDKRGFSSKAFLCDFATSTTTTTTNPTPTVWEELPPMPSELDILMGVASPLDGKVYAFGLLRKQHLTDPYTYMGLVFDPSSKSWNQCPHPFNGGNIEDGYGSIKDYTVVHAEDENPSSTQLVVFTDFKGHTFNLATSKWEHIFSATVPIPRGTSPDWDSDSTCVAVGHLVYKFYDRKLYALDSSSPKPCFELVHGLDNKLPTYWETYGETFIVYLGKGKLCIVWGHNRDPAENAPKGTLYIACLKFWVGMCNQRNRLHAVIDRCERFVAHGIRLYDVIAF